MPDGRDASNRLTEAVRDAVRREAAQRDTGPGPGGGPTRQVLRQTGPIRISEGEGLPPIRRRERRSETFGELLARSLPAGELWYGLWLAVREAVTLAVLTWFAIIALALIDDEETWAVLGAEVAVWQLALAVAVVVRLAYAAVRWYAGRIAPR